MPGGCLGFFPSTVSSWFWPIFFGSWAAPYHLNDPILRVQWILTNHGNSWRGWICWFPTCFLKDELGPLKEAPFFRYILLVYYDSSQDHQNVHMKVHCLNSKGRILWKKSCPVVGGSSRKTSWWTNPFEKYAQVKLEKSPQRSGWTWKKHLKLKPKIEMLEPTQLKNMRKSKWDHYLPPTFRGENKNSLVVEPPIWKICSSNWRKSPQVGMKIKNSWNHHLEKCLSCHHPKITLASVEISMPGRRALSRREKNLGWHPGWEKNHRNEGTVCFPKI